MTPCGERPTNRRFSSFTYVCFITLTQGTYPSLGNESIAELEQQYFPGESPLGLFRLCKVYMDSCLVIGDESTVSTQVTVRAKFHKAL